MQSDIHCVPNSGTITATVTHKDGRDFNIRIPPNRALIDAGGLIRFFSLEYDDGEVHGYKLHPYHSATEERVLWAVDFLIGLGLSRVSARLVKPSPGMPAHQAEAVHMGRYLTFNNPGGQIIRSFVEKHFLPEHLGYHNIITDELIWTSPLRVKMS